MKTSDHHRRLPLALLPIAGLFLATPAAFAAGDEPKGPPPLPPQELRVIDAEGAPEGPSEKAMSEVERYCLNIADQAQDARLAMQQEQLKALEGQIEVKIGELEAKRAEYQKWLEERQAFLESASTVVIDIYAQMDPEAAAAQLARIDRESAASVLVRLKSRQASDILTEMSSETAALLAGIIVEKTAGRSDAAPASAPGNPS